MSKRLREKRGKVPAAKLFFPSDNFCGHRYMIRVTNKSKLYVLPLQPGMASRTSRDDTQFPVDQKWGDLHAPTPANTQS